MGQRVHREWEEWYRRSKTPKFFLVESIKCGKASNSGFSVSGAQHAI